MTNKLDDTLASTPHLNVDPARNLGQEGREAIVGNIPAALDALPAGSSSVIEHFGTREGKSFGLAITHERILSTSASGRIGDRDGYRVLSIQGTVSGDEGQGPTTFPMYRVTQAHPGTDSKWLQPHYEISTANPEAQGGYAPVALVMQSILARKDGDVYEGSPRIGGWSDMFQDSVGQLFRQLL